MRLVVLASSRVAIDLRATGILRVAAHDPTLAAHLRAATVEVADADGAFDAPIEIEAPADAIEAPAAMTAADRGKLLENLRGPEVLDAARYPAVKLVARYAGTRARGHVSGTLTVRGEPAPWSADVTCAPEGDGLRVTGAWEGRLTALGVKPFRALMGAIRLDDWIRLRLDVHLGAGAAP